MAVAYVISSGSIEGSGISSLATGTSTSSSGNFLAATAGVYDTDGTVASPFTWSDSKTNSWALARGQNFAGSSADDGRIEIAYAMNITGGASHTVTCTPGDTGLSMTVCSHEFSGVATSSALDQVNSSTGFSGTASTGSVTAGFNGVAIGMVAYDGGATTIANGGGSWNLAYEGDENNDTQDQHVEYQAATASGSYTLSCTLGTSRNWAGCIANFKEATGGGGAVVCYLPLMGVG